MAQNNVVETVYGKYSKYEIVREYSNLTLSTKFYIYKDGKKQGGSYSSLSDAVEAAKRAG
jgi:hypothetical protein